MTINKNFKERQRRLLNKLSQNDIAIIFSAKETQRNGETSFPFHQNSDFFYLTGFDEPNAIAVFSQTDMQNYILFSQKKDPSKEQWTGIIAGQEEACERYGADLAFTIEQAQEIITKLIKNKEKIYSNFDFKSQHQLLYWIEKGIGAARTGVNYPTDIINIGKITHEMRLIKDDHEIDLLRTASDITAKAVTKAMIACKPNMLENQLRGIIAAEFLNNGAMDNSFDPIIAGGKNACILHYPQGQDKLTDGELVLVDVGAEYQYYCGDITRTFPINGKFTPEQKALYQAVLDTQLAVIAAIKPGESWYKLQEIAREEITNHLVELEILQGDIQKLVSEEAYKPFYMHHIGHWIGLDAHDVGKYNLEDNWRILQPGMVLTVEPGVYISENISSIDPKWRNIGIRIEDDILVTENGFEVLSKNVPKTISDIEEMCVRQN